MQTCPTVPFNTALTREGSGHASIQKGTSVCVCLGVSVCVCLCVCVCVSKTLEGPHMGMSVCSSRKSF